MSSESVYVADLHKEVREELVRVDAKIGVLLRSFLVAVAVVAAGTIAGNWRPSDLSPIAHLVWWIGIGLVVISIGRLVATLIPRTVHSRPPIGPPRYFADIAALNSADDLLARTQGASPEARIADQAYELAAIVAAKYRAITHSVLMYAAGLATAVLAVVFG